MQNVSKALAVCAAIVLGVFPQLGAPISACAIGLHGRPNFGQKMEMGTGDPGAQPGLGPRFWLPEIRFLGG